MRMQSIDNAKVARLVPAGLVFGEYAQEFEYVTFFHSPLDRSGAAGFIVRRYWGWWKR